ncbi:MAG: hypothetical protein A4E32_00925 [Methanomassiliicoccales archaeon PtaU1.Bin124]|nr:MAG: hypothetical protein A4E32_00925 [Methanomassiliicoccales archaeon PtaU1.Bin124]
MRFKVVRICNSEANTCIPLDPVKFNLKRTAEELRKLDFQVDSKDLMIIAKKEGVEYTVYRTGKVLIHPMSKEKAKEAIEVFYPLCVEGSEDD